MEDHEEFRCPFCRSYLTDLLIDELVKTGSFSNEEAKKYIQKFNREGQIFERSPEYWAKA